MRTSYTGDWKIMVDALQMEGRRFEVSEEGVVRIRHWNREITIGLTNGSGFVEIKSFECCKKISGPSEQTLSAMAKLGVISLKSLIASAFINNGYEKALEIKRCYEKIKL
ncbi:MAG: hypothetical protein QXO16_02335 [Archaeoglobaceae archaeon]